MTSSSSSSFARQECLTLQQRITLKVNQMWERNPEAKLEWLKYCERHEQLSEIKTEDVELTDDRLPQTIQKIVTKESVESIKFQYRNEYRGTKSLFVVKKKNDGLNSKFSTYEFFYMSDDFVF